MSIDKENGEAFPYSRFVSGCEAYFQGRDLSCGHLKQLADDATAAVKWSGGGMNMTPLGSFEPSLRNDALVGNYRRAKLCEKYPARARTVYEYHLDAGGRCVAALLHNSPDKQAEWGPFGHEVYFCGSDGQTVYYCHYDGNDPDQDLSRGPSYLYAYSESREGVPRLSLVYNARCPGYVLYADELSEENTVVSTQRYVLMTVEDYSFVSDLSAPMIAAGRKPRVQTAVINGKEYRVLRKGWSL